MDKYRNRAVGLDHSMKLDRPLCFSELCPGKHRQTQIYSRCIQRVCGCFQVGTKLCVGIQRTSDVDESPSKVRVDSPISTFVGIGQRGPSDWSTESAMIQLMTLRTQTHFYISQTFPICELSEGHSKKLIPTSEALGVSVAIVASNATTELVVRKKLHELSEYSLSLVHRSPPSGPCLPHQAPKNQETISNRRNQFLPVSLVSS